MITLKMALIVGVSIVAFGGIVTGIVFAVIGDSCEVFKAPSDLYFAPTDGKLIVKWRSPNNVNDCAVKYKLLITVNGKETAIETEEEEYEIEEEIGPCTSIKATLTAINDNEEDSDEITKEYRIGVGDVSRVTVKDIIPIESENGWIIKWEKPEGYEICAITYKITVGENTIIDKEYPTETIKISNDKFFKCTRNSVKVQPKIRDNDGKEDTTTFYVDVDDVSEVTIKGIISTPSKNGWIIEWEKIEGYESCETKYKVTVGDKIVSEAGDTETIEISNENLKTCKENTIKIQPKIKGKYGQEETTTVIGGVGDVSQVTVKGLAKIQSGNDLTLKWEKPDGYEDCALTYKITMGENTIIDEIHTTETIEILNDKLDKCKDNIIKVQPKIEESNGKADTIAVFGDLGDVSQVTVKGLYETETQNGWILKWEKPDRYKECTFTYKIMVGESTIINDAHATETIDISNDELDRCVYNDVTIQPKIEGSNGKADTIRVLGGVGDVSQVTIKGLDKTESENGWIIIWEKPDEYENCIFVYKIMVGESTIIEEAHATETIEILNGKFDKCKDNIVTVQPKIRVSDWKIEGSDGKADTITITLDHGDVSGVKVENLKTEEENNGWTATWEKPSGYESCTITYELNINSVVEQNSITETCVLIKNGDVKTCEENSIEITPIFKEDRGLSDEIPINGNPVSIGEVQNGKIEVTAKTNLVKVSWTKPDGLDKCIFSYKVVLKKNGEEVGKGDVESKEEWEDNVADIVSCDDLLAQVTAVYNEKSGITKDIFESECAIIE